MYAYKGLVFVSDRPEIIRKDDEARLHCEDGPAIRFTDGYGVYCWHGLNVPDDWINKKSDLTPKIALTWQNVEQRRAACEILGWDSILNELDAYVVDKDPDPQIGELLSVEIPEIGRENFLRVQCGTGRAFSIPVPPEMRTALQAQAWMVGLEPQDFQTPEVRT